VSVGQRRDPYLGSRFVLEVESLVVGAFAEVSGLERQLETEEYQEGGVNTHSHALPTRAGSPNLVCKRGMTDSQVLWEWARNAADGQVVRKSGQVFLLDASGTPTWGWAFADAYPVKWTGPDLQADQGAVAVETLELTHDGITAVPGLPAGPGSSGAPPG
jgi:phage tail-like protein